MSTRNERKAMRFLGMEGPMKRFGQEQELSQRLMSAIERLSAMSEESPDRPSFEDQYGDALQSITDRVMAQTGTASEALTRGTMATGGDVTGSAGVTARRIGEGGARAIGEAESGFRSQFSREDEERRRMDQGRSDRLLGASMQMLGGERDYLQGNRLMEQQRRDQKRQANRQMFGDVLGLGGSLGGAAILACWVAEKLYGEDDDRTHTVRAYVLDNKDADTPIGKFSRIYQENGREWAELVENDPVARDMAKAVWDMLLEQAEES